MSDEEDRQEPESPQEISLPTDSPEDGYLEEKAIELEINEQNFSEEETADILKSIEDFMMENRIQLTEDDLKLKAVRKGFILPITIAVSIASILMLTFFIMNLWLKTSKKAWEEEERRIDLESSDLIEALKEENLQRLNEKEEEIKRIQEEMDSLLANQADLASRFAEEYRRRELSLKDEIDKELEREREELIASGRYTQDEVDQLVEQSRDEKQREMQTALQQLTSQQEAEKQSLEQQLEESRRRQEESLRQAQDERDRIERESQERLEALEEELQSSKSGQDQQFADMQRLMEEEDTIVKFVNSYFRRVRAAINSENYNRALSEIESTEAYLADPKLLRYPRISIQLPGYKENLLALRTMVSNIVEYESKLESLGVEQGELKSLLSSFQMPVAQIERLISSGRQNNERGNYQQALNNYKRALELSYNEEELSSIGDPAIAGFQEALDQYYKQVVDSVENQLQEVEARSKTLETEKQSLIGDLEQAEEELSHLISRFESVERTRQSNPRPKAIH